jgi:LCP family protein required for cell wall assembly
VSPDSWGEWPQQPGPRRPGGGLGPSPWGPPPPQRPRPQPTAVLPLGQQPHQYRPVRESPLPPPPPPRPAPLRRPRRGRRIGVVLAVLLLALVAFAVYVDFTLNRVDAIPADSTAKSEGTNWLIVGSDSRDGLSKEEQRELATGGDVGQRTDTIMLLHSGSSGSVLVSLPRDSFVDIPGHRRNKLNAAYAFGGPELLVRTVEQATGLRIDHYVEIGFLGFVDAVDAVGGVEICAKQAIRDPKAALNIKAGCQEMDGATALGYVRTRATAGSDFDRVERQRQFLSALVSKATSPATLVNPIRTVPLAFAMSGAITVDSGDHVWNLAGLGLAMRSLTGGEGITTTVPVGSLGSSGGQSVVRWDKERALALFGALDRDERPPKSALGP